MGIFLRQHKFRSVPRLAPWERFEIAMFGEARCPFLGSGRSRCCCVGSGWQELSKQLDLGKDGDLWGLEGVELGTRGMVVNLKRVRHVGLDGLNDG